MTGLVIRDTSNNIMVDMTMNISQTQGSVDTGAVNGSISITAPPTGKTQYFIVVPLVNLQREKGKRPAVTIS